VHSPYGSSKLQLGIRSWGLALRPEVGEGSMEGKLRESVSRLDGRGGMQQRLAQSAASIRADIGFAFVDSGIIIFAYLAALAIRSIESAAVADIWWPGLIAALPVILAVHLSFNLVFGAYGHVWEFASIGEAIRVIAATASSAFVLLVIELVNQRMTGSAHVPLGVIILGSALTAGGMGAVRFRSRLFSLKRMNAIAAQPDAERTLIVGTTQPAVDLARHGSSTTRPMDVVGFVATGDNGFGERRIAGRPVFGNVDEVPDLVRYLEIKQLIIADPRSQDLARKLVDACMNVDVRLGILPIPDDILAGTAGLDVRELELSDLLSRPVVHTDLAPVSELLTGERVLVTGAGGSIGSEIVRQVLEFEPEMVVALDHDETHLHDAAVAWAPGATTLTLELADIREAARVIRCFEQYRPTVVFHAAAHKHVPILEDFPEEALKTNVQGTQNLLEATRLFEATRFVLISTDKAVDPSSVMGASKRVAEMMIVNAATDTSPCTYAAVRFGNVLGSRGSVVPTFMRQVQQGGPVTVSDPRMERYFMTVDEAVQLVLQASAISRSGEVFVLDMGEPVKILDLAHRIIRLSGRVPDRDVAVEITGIREGEKLTEVLSATPLEASEHPQIRIASTARPGRATLHDARQLMQQMLEDGDRRGIKEVLISLARHDWDVDETIDLTDAALEITGRAS